MKLLLALAPFYPPSAPPLGIAYLKAAINQKARDVSVRLIDWNAQFFSRWLGGTERSFCDYCPNNGLACLCPDILLEGEEGRGLIERLRLIPQSKEEQECYMNAAIRFQGIYNSLRYCYNAHLRPLVENRKRLSSRLLEGLFHEELSVASTEKPDVIGFSVLSEHNLLYALALSKVFKQELNLPNILGGAMLSHLDLREILAAFDWVDYVFLGEAEETLPLFLSRWPDKTGTGVGGLFYRSNVDNYQHTFHSVPSLDDLPLPDFSAFVLEDYLVGTPVLPVVSSRGCYWGRCTFCSHTRPYAPGIRYRTIKKVGEEIEYHKSQFGIRHFLLVDEVISPGRLQALSKEFLARNMNIIFGAEGIRPERGFTLPLLKMSHEAGLRWIYVGVESITQRLLDLMEKGTRVEDICQLIAYCDELGITTHLSYIIGIPSQTPQELTGEIPFLQDRPVDSAPFVLLLGSGFQREPERYGIKIEDQEVLYCTDKGSLHAPRFYFTADLGLSPAQAVRIVHEYGQFPKARPHLGEIHAVWLSDIGFFGSIDRPSSIDSPEIYAEKVLLKKRSKTPWDLLHLAGCYETQWETEQALNVLVEAWNKGQYNGIKDQFLLHIAACLNQLGQSQQVIEVIKMADFSPEVVAALWGELARAYFSLHQYEEAADAAEKMLVWGSGGAGVYFALGLCYEILGRHTDALQILHQAQEIDIKESEINLALSRCYKALGDHEGYLREVNKAQRKGRWA